MARRGSVIGPADTVMIYVAPGIMADDSRAKFANFAARRSEEERRLVRDSVRDLARVLQQVAGARVNIESQGPGEAEDGTFRIDIGSSAESKYGQIGLTAPYGQAFRVVVADHAAGLYGETNLATSYAIYELLDRIGCRWFFPGALGEVLPERGAVVLKKMDERHRPSTDYRGVWYADDAWKRRNRAGGLLLQAGHALERAYVTKEDRNQHPEWVGTVRGKPHPVRLRWSSPALAEHIGERILERHRKDGAPSYSLSPDDGVDFDDSPEDRSLDAGDFDPAFNTPSITDRYLTLANRIASHVAASAPEVVLGFLAYGPCTRPPVRESVHPNLVPQIAPIGYARAHPMSDDRVPGNPALRHAIERWGERPGGTSIYFYGWFLSEPVAPNPMLTKWGHDVPYVLAHGARYWQPETFPNFETSMHALYMSMRLAFDARLKPDHVYADIDTRLYGAAGAAMHTYWKEVDRTWVETREYSGGPFGQTRRFPPQRLAYLRDLLEAAKEAAEKDVERRRIELADDSLSLFEELMRLRYDFIDGRFRGLAARGEAYRSHAASLGRKWSDAFAFSQTRWARDTIYANYYDAFQKPSFVAMTELAETQEILSIVRKFRWHAERRDVVDPALVTPGFDDSKWGLTDVAVDSWSSLGLHDYFGSMWYRTTVHAKITDSRRMYLSVSSVDGSARVFVNGAEAAYAPTESGPKVPASGGGPLRFDVTNLVLDGDNTITVLATRKELIELGLGGLMGPVVLSRPR
ncbi:MAG TPA: DUF4838 domain-containing protein [Labilithrix sp.]|nr:DUF4838 domain-containing protein [Labilithrix sp.]